MMNHTYHIVFRDNDGDVIAEGDYEFIPRVGDVVWFQDAGSVNNGWVVNEVHLDYYSHRMGEVVVFIER